MQSMTAEQNLACKAAIRIIRLLGTTTSRTVNERYDATNCDDTEAYISMYYGLESVDGEPPESNCYLVNITDVHGVAKITVSKRNDKGTADIELFDIMISGNEYCGGSSIPLEQGVEVLTLIAFESDEGELSYYQQSLTEREADDEMEAQRASFHHCYK